MKPEEYTQAANALAQLRERHEAEWVAQEAAHKKEMELFWDREVALREEKYEAQRKQEGADKTLTERHKQECAPPAAVIKAGERIFALMDIARSGKVAAMGKVYVYTDSYPRERKDLPCLDVVAADEYKQVGVWIVPNGKPKNRFSLAVLCWSVFHTDQFGPFADLYLAQGYLAHVNDEPYARWRRVLREAPDEAALRAWYNAHSDKLFLPDYLATHAKVEAELREAKEMLADPAWHKLYLEHKKDYYEHGYVGGTELPEYQDIVNELAVLEQG